MSDLDPLYANRRWRRIRKRQLELEPLCRFCLAQGLPVPATTVDHIEPHRGDLDAFWRGKLQSLCSSCHSKLKQDNEEVRGFFPGCDVTGWPLDRRHPARRER